MQDGDVKTFSMTKGEGCQWHCQIMLPPDIPEGKMSYHYSVHRQQQLVAEEWVGHGHTICYTRTGIQQHTIYDNWIALPSDAYQHLYDDNLLQCLHRRELVTSNKGNEGGAFMRLKVRAPQLHSNQHLVLVGEHPVLGQWDVTRGIPCHEQQPCEWYCDINTDYIAGEEQHFKFAVLTQGDNSKCWKNGDNSIYWENGDNRHFTPPRVTRGEIAEFELHEALFHIPPTRVTGTFVREYSNLKKLIDWIQHTNQNILQITGYGISTQQMHEAKLYAKERRILLLIGETERLAPLTWWEDNKYEAQQYHTNIMQRRDTAPHPLPQWLARDIIMRKLLSPEPFCIITLEDWLTIHTKKKAPLLTATKGSYSSLLANTRFCDDIAEMVRQSNRVL